MVNQAHPRNIVILCDGTGKNGRIDSRKGEPITNIWRLYNAIKHAAAREDFVEYIPGVGAEHRKVTLGDWFTRAFGNTVVYSVRDIYMTIVREYRSGDRISLFGYSRGAFIVRKVASLIGALGLIKDEAKFNQYWKSMEHKLPGRKRTPLLPRNPQVVPISCVGVWDTVGAVRSLVIRETLNLLSLPDHDLSDIVQSALHVVAYHENRKLFDVVLFNDEHKKRNQICEQMLFAGCHSDVGGGGIPPHGGKNILPDVTLDWMVRNMPSTLRVALGETLKAEVPPWYPLQSAYHDGPFWKRIPDKLFRRRYLTMTPDLKYHDTLLGLPSPNSPHLLEHEWEFIEKPDGVAENGMPLAKPAATGSLMVVTNSGATYGPQESAARPPPPIPPRIPTATRPRLLKLPSPTLSPNSPDSVATDFTYFSTDTQETISTPATSVFSPAMSPGVQYECNNAGSPGYIPDRPGLLSPVNNPGPPLFPPQLPPRRAPPIPPPLPPRGNTPARMPPHDAVPFPTSSPSLPPRRPIVPAIVEPVHSRVNSTVGRGYLPPPSPTLSPILPHRHRKKSFVQGVKDLYHKTFD